MCAPSIWSYMSNFKSIHTLGAKVIAMKFGQTHKLLTIYHPLAESNIPSTRWVQYTTTHSLSPIYHPLTDSNIPPTRWVQYTTTHSLNPVYHPLAKSNIPPTHRVQYTAHLLSWGVLKDKQVRENMIDNYDPVYLKVN